MEAVFKTPELVDLILQTFRVTPSEYRGRRFWQGPSRHISRADLISNKTRRGILYCMALTNRAISEMALPILWSTIDGILPLLKLISKFEYNATMGRWVIARPLLEDDLQRFYILAAMVRHIDLPTRRGHLLVVYPAIHLPALAEICKLTAARPLIPYLQTLSFDDECDYATLFLAETLECVRIVRGGNKRTIHQVDYPPRPSVWNFLALLHTRAPFVEELYIGSPPSSSNLQDILRLRHLRKLTLNIPRYSWPGDERAKYRFLKELGCLPKLQALDLGQSIQNSKDPQAPLLTPELYSYTFPALESFTFQGFGRHLSTILPRFYATPNLKSLVFCHSDERWGHGDYSAGGEEHGLQSALSLLATNHFRTLTTLYICGPIETLLKATHLEPLLQISGMERFELQDTVCYGITDETIQKMASAWHKLEVFCLLSENTWFSEGHTPTLGSIQTFARHCPNLRRLSLDLGPNIPSLEDSDPRTLYRLEQLTVFSLAVNAFIGKANVPALTRYISATFPALLFAFVELGEWDTGSVDDWQAVCRALSADRTPEEVSQLKDIFRLV